MLQQAAGCGQFPEVGVLLGERVEVVGIEAQTTVRGQLPFDGDALVAQRLHARLQVRHAEDEAVLHLVAHEHVAVAGIAILGEPAADQGEVVVDQVEERHVDREAAAVGFEVAQRDEVVAVEQAGVQRVLLGCQPGGPITLGEAGVDLLDPAPQGGNTSTSSQQ